MITISLDEYRTLVETATKWYLLSKAVEDDIHKNGDCYKVYSNKILQLLTDTLDVKKEDGNE